LCLDACDWSAEARRRVKKFRESGSPSDGDRILIMGEDIDGKTDDIGSIVIKVDERFSRICGGSDPSFEARLLAPLKAADEAEEDVISKNDSSVILRVDLKVQHVTKARYLIGGDADVNGELKCIADGPGDKPLTIEVLSSGSKIKRAAFATALGLGTGIGSQPLAHGGNDEQAEPRYGVELCRLWARAAIDCGA
jgi:hypothetical protein